MKAVDIDKRFANDDEDFLYEEGSELKHELINVNLYQLSSALRYHNKFERFIRQSYRRIIESK